MKLKKTKRKNLFSFISKNKESKEDKRILTAEGWKRRKPSYKAQDFS
jgi:hypothetical protein